MSNDILDGIDYSITDKLELTPKKISDILSRYLVDHSSRKFNYIYWYINPTNSPNLCFCNMTSDKIDRINDPALAFRIVKVTDRVAWRVLKFIIGDILLAKSDRRVVQVISLSHILQYLKSIKYDLPSVSYNINKFGTRVWTYTDKKKKAITKVLASEVNDIHCQYLMDRLYHTYLPYVNSETEELSYDYTEELLKKKTFAYEPLGGVIAITCMPGLDTVSTKLLKKKGSTHLLHHYEGDSFSVVHKYVSDEMIVVSLRAFTYFHTKVFKDTVDELRSGETKHE